jgi:hypothetical protein
MHKYTELWNRWVSLEKTIANLKGIIQNDVQISTENIDTFIELSDRCKNKLGDLTIDTCMAIKTNNVLQEKYYIPVINKGE